MVGWATLPLDSLVTLPIGPEVATCSLVKAVLLDTLPMEYPREDWAMLLLMEWSNVVEGEEGEEGGGIGGGTATDAMEEMVSISDQE